MVLVIMKILNKEEFLALPAGIIYSKYQPVGMFDGLYLKGESLENDWKYKSLISTVDFPIGDSDVNIYLLNVQKHGATFRMDLECGERDGLYNTDEYFAVYDTTDVRELLMELVEKFKHYPEVDL